MEDVGEMNFLLLINETDMASQPLFDNFAYDIYFIIIKYILKTKKIYTNDSLIGKISNRK